MKRRVCGIIAALAVLLCSMLYACTTPPQNKDNSPTLNKYSAHSMDWFDTVTTVTGYAESQEAFDAVADEMLSLLAEYHRLYSIYHRFENLENLCTVNELTNGVHRTVTVDRRIIDLLLYAKEMYRLTDGTVNVAMGSVLSLWHDHRAVGMDDPANATLPPMERLQEAAKHTNIDDVIIDETACTVTLADPQMKLDVGAVAKGYAAQRVADSLVQKGISGYVLNVGGNVCTVGTKPDGDGWTVGIEDPDGGSDYLEYLSLSDRCVVTSGSYQRYYYVDGKKYHHIIDPDTLMPAEGYLSVSVVCDDAGLGDVLSTALFCLPQSEGLALVESIPEVQAMWIREDGTKTVSSDWTINVKK